MIVRIFSWWLEFVLIWKRRFMLLRWETMGVARPGRFFSCHAVKKERRHRRMLNWLGVDYRWLCNSGHWNEVKDGLVFISLLIPNFTAFTSLKFGASRLTFLCFHILYNTVYFAKSCTCRTVSQTVASKGIHSLIPRISSQFLASMP